jgi:Na+/H+ antiporter NhaC
MEHFGALSLIPPLVVILVAMRTRLAIESLVVGCMVGYLMLSHGNVGAAFGAFTQSMLKALGDESMVWIILVCGFYGSVIELMVRSGGAMALGERLLRHITTRRNSLLATWALGIVLFLDDYLSALTTGSTMRKVTDTFRVPRELLALFVNGTAAAVCVIVPLSTWSIYVGGLLEKNNYAAQGQGLSAYFSIIPYTFYGWAVVGVLLLAATGALPILGKKMKAAVARTESGGALSPAGSERMVQRTESFPMERGSSMWYFLWPMLVLMVATAALELDALKGVVVALLFTVGYYWLRRVAPFALLSESLVEGFKSMVFPLGVLFMSYVLKNVGDEMHLTEYVIQSAAPHVSKEWLPLILFWALSFIAFTTASSWGLYAIAIPIVLPLAQSVGADLPLCLGAIVSSGALGSNACFFSDDSTLTASSTECNMFEHSTSQFPYVLLSFGLASALFLAAGYF